MLGVSRKVRFKNCFLIGCLGRSKVLALCWKDESRVSLIGFSRNHINVCVKSLGTFGKSQFTGFYGHPETTKHKFTWNLLEGLGVSLNILWTLGGYFNNILALWEKEGDRWPDVRSLCKMLTLMLIIMIFLHSKSYFKSHIDIKCLYFVFCK